MTCLPCYPTCSGRTEEEDCACAKLLHAVRQIDDGHLVCLVLFSCVEKSYWISDHVEHVILLKYMFLLFKLCYWLGGLMTENH